MASGSRGQKRSRNPSITSILGDSRELLMSELPTLRQCLQFALLLDERSEQQLKKSEKLHQVAEKVHQIWSSVNPLMPLSPVKSMKTLLTRKWDKLLTMSRLTYSEPKRDEFISKLDTLFDICKCKCLITKCDDAGCQGCDVKVHISCTCPVDSKIPVSELLFMYHQRQKTGPISEMQIGPVDSKEVGRYKKLQKRLTDSFEKAQKHDVKSKEQFETVTLISSDDTSSPEKTPASARRVTRTTRTSIKSEDMSTESDSVIDVSKIAAASIRYGVSVRATAAISTATMSAAKDAKLIDKDIIIDHSKVRRAKDKQMKDVNQRVGPENKVIGILFDGRNDKTRVMNKEADGKYHVREVQEEHYSVCNIPGGDYLTHLTCTATGKGKAIKLGGQLYDWLDEKNITETIQAIGGDSTNVNTGWRGGAITEIEKRLKRKCIWLICALHTNELPLRHLMTSLDGKTISNNKFSGNIGKLIDTATTLKLQESIPSIGINIELPTLNEKVENDLSADQKYLYQIVNAIKAGGQLPTSLQYRMIGPHNHARWLNLANRLCRIFCSEHGLSTEDTNNLKLLVQFIVGVYAPMWFDIKMKNKWTEGPNHVLKQIKLVRSQDEKVKTYVEPFIQSTAWNGHSEAVLQCMLVSDKSDLRKFAVDKITQLRNGEEKGDKSVRPFKMPMINLQCKDFTDIIDWKSQIHEPLLTCDMSIDALTALKDTPMEVPDFPVHGQAIERCVKAVTRSCSAVIGHEKRDGYIKATMDHRKLMSSNNSKKDLMALFDTEYD